MLTKLMSKGNKYLQVIMGFIGSFRIGKSRCGLGLHRCGLEQVTKAESETINVS
jgi:hypothetical protein